MNRFIFSLGVLFLAIGALHAQPDGVVSSVQREGVIVTSGAQPEFFIFRNGNFEEHFDGSTAAMMAQGGLEQGEPIAGLRYMRPRQTVDGPPWSAEDAKLIDAQFHGTGTGNFYLFKTIEGRLFYLPKQGETAVVRVDYLLKNGLTVTVWTRK